MHYRRMWMCALALLLWAECSWAVLTDAQYDALAHDILVTHQAEFAADVEAINDQAIADAYNAPANPLYWVWRTSLTEKEIYEATADGGAKWSWATFKGQPVADRDSWDTLMHPLVINPSLEQTRDSFTTIFGAQGPSATQRDFLLALSRRHALRIEALLASSGNGTTATPSVMGYEGQLRAIDIAHALRGVPLT